MKEIGKLQDELQSIIATKVQTENQNTEDIKQKFCSELESILSGVKLKNYRTDDGDSFPLVDHLSETTDNTISSGKEEISNIVEQIYFQLDELSIFKSLSSSQDESKEEHKTCDGCVVFGENGCNLDDSCQECIDRDMYTSQEQMDKRIKDAYVEISHVYEIAVDDIKAAIGNYIDAKYPSQSDPQPDVSKEDIEKYQKIYDENNSINQPESEQTRNSDLKGKIAVIISKWNHTLGNEYPIGQAIDDICKLFQVREAFEPIQLGKERKPEEFLVRGKGSFINCTDYDDAIQAMKEYASQFHPKAEIKETVKGMTDEEIEIIRKFLKFAEPIYWGENEYTTYEQILDELYRSHLTQESK